MHAHHGKQTNHRDTHAMTLCPGTTNNPSAPHAQQVVMMMMMMMRVARNCCFEFAHKDSTSRYHNAHMQQTWLCIVPGNMWDRW
jgi:hypothetical protein